jgi:hypothetical protein
VIRSVYTESQCVLRRSRNATALKKVTEYAVGRLLRDRALPKHRGGLYVARSPQAPTLASCDISRYLKWLVVSNIFYFPKYGIILQID